MRIDELEQILTDGVYDPHIFKAVFMAGSPGAGKSTIANKLFRGSGLKVLNVDAFWQLYKSKGQRGDYDRYWDLYKAQEGNFLNGRLGLIIDGTAKNPERMAKVKNDLEAMGYDTAMVFVNTSLETSLQRVAQRAQGTGKDAGREVAPEFVQDAWEKTQKGLGALQSMFQGNFFIVDNNNNRNNPNIGYVDKAMRAWLNKKPTHQAAREWMQQQLSTKQQGPADVNF